MERSRELTRQTMGSASLPALDRRGVTISTQAAARGERAGVARLPTSGGGRTGRRSRGP